MIHILIYMIVLYMLILLLQNKTKTLNQQKIIKSTFFVSPWKISDLHDSNYFDYLFWYYKLP